MTRVGLGIPSAAVYRGRRPASGAVQAAALLARMSPAASVPRAGQVSALVAALVAAGVWQKLDALYLLAAHDAQAARLNWISSAYNLTAVNSPTFTVDRGYTPSVAAYLDTGFNPASAASPAFTRYAASLGAWSLSEINEVGCLIGGAGSDAATNCAFVFPYPGYFSANGNSTSRATVSSLGFFSVSRQDAGGYASYLQGASPVFTALAPGVVASGNIFVGRRNNTQFTSRQMAAAFIGGGLSDANMLALHGAIRTYLIAVGAWT